jgi:NTE family protein
MTISESGLSLIFAIRAALARKPWISEFDPLSGVVLHQQADWMAAAAD